MKKVLNLLFNDFTNDNRVLKESRTLQSNGFDVILLATHFKKELPKEEVIEGFKVRRINVGRIKLLPLNLILFWIKVVFLYKKEGIIHANDLYALPPAAFIKKFINKRVKVVYDCHEHETEAQIYNGKKLLKKLAQIFEKRLIYSADSIITVSKSIAEDYVKMYKIELPKLVLNSPPYQGNKVYDLLRKDLGISKDKTIFLFQGNYIAGRGVDDLIGVFERIEERNTNIVLVLLMYGKGVEYIKEKVKNAKNIFFHEKVSVLEYMKYVSSADWGIYLMENNCKNSDYALPNKIFDYIMGGLPVVVSNLKEMGSFVRGYEIGITVNSQDQEEILDVLEKIHHNSGEEYMQALEKVAKKYSWEEQEKVLLKIYNSL